MAVSEDFVLCGTSGRSTSVPISALAEISLLIPVEALSACSAQMRLAMASFCAPARSRSVMLILIVML